MIYVAYGSNINKKQMAHRCPDAKFSAVGQAMDSQLVFNTVATLHECPGATAPVMIWDMSDADEKKMDVYEGFPHKYHKEQVTVQLSSGEYITGIAYVMNDRTHQGAPTEEYYNRIADGYIEAGFDLKVLEEAYDRSVEYEVDSNQLTFEDLYDYEDYTGITNFDEDLLYRGFLIGQWCANNNIALSADEIHDLTIELSELYDEIPMFYDEGFEAFVDEQLSYEDYQQEQQLYYAAYGSNMVEEQMMYRCPHSKQANVGYVIDMKLEFCTYANITPQDNATTPCLLWNIDPRDWRALDRYEGYPSLYRKEEIDVDLNGERITAIAYVLNDQYRKPQMPSAQYLDAMIGAYNRLGIDNTPIAAAVEETLQKSQKKHRSNDGQGQKI